MKDQSKTKHTLIKESASREYAESIINTVREPLIILDQDLRVVTASRSFYEFFKVKPEETEGQLIYNLGNEQWDIPKLRELLETIIPQKTTFDNYEVEHDFAAIGKRIMLLNARQIHRVLGRERIILLAIEDITERKRLENLLTDSEERYRHLFETASDGIVFLEQREGKITHANPATEKMLGYTEKESIGNKLQDIGVLLDLGDFQTTIQNLNKSGIIHYNDVSVRTKSGQQMDTDIYLVDRATLVQCSIRDVTERERAEETLRENEEKFRTIFNRASDGILIADAKTKQLFQGNTAICSMLKYTKEEIGSLTIYDIHPPKDVSHVLDEFEKLLKGEKFLSEGLPVLRKDGSIFYADISSTPITIGGIHYLVGIFRDITERKRAEEEVLESERRYREFFSTSRDCVFITSTAGKWIDFNDAALEMFGYDSREELFQVSISSLYINPEERSLFLALIEKQSYVKEHPVRLRRKDGAVIDALITSGFRQNADGSNREYYGTIRDITERKRVEEELARSEENFHKEHKFNKLIFDTSPALIVAISANGKALMMNQTLLDVLEYSIDEIKGVDYLTTFVPEEDRGTLAPIFQQIVREEKVTINENRIRSKSGQIYLIEWHGRPMIHEGGDIDFFVGVGIDITERKQMEDSLQKSEENFRRSLDDSPLGVRISSIESETIYANRAILDIYGYDSVEELKKTPLKERYTPESYANFQLRKEKRLRGEFGPSEYEISIVRKNGEIRHLHVFRKEIFWNGRKQSQIVYQDITERKQAEEALRENEEKYRTILENIQEGYFEVDPAGNFTFFNDSTCFLLGYSKEELMGMNYRQYTDKEHSKKVFQTYNKIYNTGKPAQEFDWQVIRKDGTRRYIEQSVSLQKDSSGKPTGFRGIVHDVTERKRAEEKLKQTFIFQQRLIDALPVPVFFKDSEGRYLGCNSSFEKFFGRKREHLTGKSVYDLSPKEIADTYHEKDLALLQNPGIQIYESIVKDMGGVVHNVIFHKATFPNMDGSVGGLIGAILDITERKKAEEELQKTLKSQESRWRDHPGHGIRYRDERSLYSRSPAPVCKPSPCHRHGDGVTSG